jgi:hypothetical protein
MGATRKFKAIVEEGPKGSAWLPLPFDPDEAWGEKPRHHVSGTIDGKNVRAIITSDNGGRGLRLTPMWRRDCGVTVGARVSVELWPEGPQQAELASDILAAFAKTPKAAAFFDDLAQFYRKAYLRWIDATKKKPEERARRIAEVVKLLKAGVKERPK